MRTILPNYYIIKRHYRDTRSPGCIFEWFQTKEYAEERRQELLKNDANNNYWIFKWDSQELKTIRAWEATK
jgi:hypothetical protein